MSSKSDTDTFNVIENGNNTPINMTLYEIKKRIKAGQKNLKIFYTPKFTRNIILGTVEQFFKEFDIKID